MTHDPSSPAVSCRQLMAGTIPFDSAITVSGWVRSRRGSKKFSFITINDGSHFENMQVIADGGLANYDEILKLTVGASVSITGQLKESPGKGQSFEIHASEVTVHGLADPEKYPIQKKSSTLEHLREHAHFRPRTATFLAISRVRHALYTALHREFTRREFYWVPTPLITSLDGEGAGESFQVTTMDLAAIPKDGNNQVDFSQDFFAKPAMLCVTGQLEGEAYAMGLGRIYTFGPTFRAENSNTSRHLAEFWMVEPEMAFFDRDDLIRFEEEFFKAVIGDVLGQCEGELANLAELWNPGHLDEVRAVVETPFARCTYTEAVEILEKSGQSFEVKPSWGVDLGAEHETFLVDQHFKAPLFITDYPKDFKAFYMYQNDDGKTVRGVDLLFPRIGEVAGGSEREYRLDRLETRIAELGLHTDELQWYLDLRRFGTTPHAGCGFGFERILTWLTGMGNIRDAIPFPRVPKDLRF